MGSPEKRTDFDQFWGDLQENLHPSEVIKRTQETFAGSVAGAIIMGAGVYYLHTAKEHGFDESIWAASTQFGYSVVMGGFLSPIYEAHANYFKNRDDLKAIIVPVAVPFAINVAMNTGTHWAAGTPELFASVAGASGASLLVLSSLHKFRRHQNDREQRGETTNIWTCSTRALRSFFHK